jgi:hypothetical protein
MFRSRGEAHAAFLNIEKRVSRRTLLVDVLLVPVVRDLAAQASSRTKSGKGRCHLVRPFHKLPDS